MIAKFQARSLRLHLKNCIRYENLSGKWKVDILHEVYKDKILSHYEDQDGKVYLLDYFDELEDSLK